jgi:competence protein ComEA
VFNRTVAGVLAVGLLLGLTLASVIFGLVNRARPAPIYITPPAPTPTQPPTATPGPLRVDVAGEVLQPAVVELPAGSIVQDAIRAAGGFTDVANRDIINLAQPLADGNRVYVPAQGEPASPPVVSGEPTGGIPAAGALININTASQQELEELPGIGPVTAASIIDYRQANGPFTTPEDVTLVSGIGEGKLAQIKDLITVD